MLILFCANLLKKIAFVFVFEQSKNIRNLH